jgi:hypothetical protein
VTWSRAFDDPIPLPDGGEIRTLKQAADHILSLPARTAKSPHWQLAMHCLIEAAEDREPLLHARVGMLRALNAGKPELKLSSRKKRVKAYRIVRAK